MTRRLEQFRYAAGVLAGIGLLQVHPTAAAASREVASTAYGHWVERDIKLDFEVRPGANPNQLVLIIPSTVTFPGSHEFLLKKAGDGSYEANDPGRPNVSLSFKSPSRANLRVRGHGDNWISMNDYVLVRP